MCTIAIMPRLTKSRLHKIMGFGSDLQTLRSFFLLDGRIVAELCLLVSLCLSARKIWVPGNEWMKNTLATFGKMAKIAIYKQQPIGTHQLF